VLQELDRPTKTIELAPIPAFEVRESPQVVLESEISVESTLATVDQALATVKQEQRLFGLNPKFVTVGAFGLAAGDLLLHSPAMMAIGFLAGTARLAYPQLKKLKRGKWFLHLAMVAGVATTGAMAMSVNTSPANAMFFSNAETFFAKTFPLSTTAVTTIFLVFRAAYVVYLIYSAIAIWTSFQRDEDWMSVAKAPIVIFIGGTLIDAVTTVITG